MCWLCTTISTVLGLAITSSIDRFPNVLPNAYNRPGTVYHPPEIPGSWMTAIWCTTVICNEHMSG